MKHFSNLMTLVSFFVILIMFSLSFIIFTDKKKIDISSGSVGELTQKTESTLAQNFPLKVNWNSLYANILVLTGRQQFDDVFLANNRLLRIHSIDKNNAIGNTKYINKFADKYFAAVNVMLVPTASGIYSAELPEYAVGEDQLDIINQIYMGFDKKVATIDCFYPLYSARSEYIFYRTEDLWTSFGAYYAYCESVKTLGVQVSKLENYDQEYASSSFTGSLYDKAAYPKITPDRINIFRSKYQSAVKSVEMELDGQVKSSSSVYFRSALKTDKETDIFLQGDKYERITVNTTNEEASRLLVIKGSYANSIIPFYTPHYSEITIIDPELVKKAGKKITDYVNPNRYEDILLIYDVDDFSKADHFDVLVDE